MNSSPPPLRLVPAPSLPAPQAAAIRARPEIFGGTTGVVNLGSLAPKAGGAVVGGTYATTATVEGAEPLAMSATSPDHMAESSCEMFFVSCAPAARRPPPPAAATTSSAGLPSAYAAAASAVFLKLR